LAPLTAGVALIESDHTTAREAGSRAKRCPRTRQQLGGFTHPRGAARGAHRTRTHSVRHRRRRRVQNGASASLTMTRNHGSVPAKRWARTP
jgi:hypothetical protein